MTIDPAIAFVLLSAAAMAGGLVIWAFLRGRIPPGVAETLAQAVAEIRNVLGDTFTDDDLAALAGWFYDNWLQGSDYYTRQQFIDLVRRALVGASTSTPAIRANFKRSVVQAGEQ